MRNQPHPCRLPVSLEWPVEEESEALGARSLTLELAAGARPLGLQAAGAAPEERPPIAPDKPLRLQSQSIAAAAAAAAPAPRWEQPEAGLTTGDPWMQQASGWVV